ncbi:unnamed protein product [Cyprideis torosa]|uniref:Nuclear pore protein n=1 Tax=Cyprideis torosa TaxID=163714 RepID=A0A7R8ZTA3_9CRUS|nr:unnamed protein product [Cyprideis torosa]CAG0897555.1 unnamed protein product [Cyprideis torosa]
MSLASFHPWSSHTCRPVLLSSICFEFVFLLRNFLSTKVQISEVTMSTVNLNILKSTQGILKVCTIIVGVICLGLYLEVSIEGQNLHFYRLCIGVFIGYLIVTGGYVVGYLTGVKTRYQETIHNFAGSVLYLVIGIIILNTAVDMSGKAKNYGIAEGVFALDVRTIEETLPEDPGVSAAANARTLVIQTKDQRPPEVGVDDKASQAQLLFGDSLDLLSYKKLGSELARRPSPPRTPPASVATPTPKATSVCRPLFVGAAEAESRDVQPPIPSTQTLDEGIADAVEKVINDLLLKSEKEAFSEQELALQDTSKETWAENQLKFVETLRGVDFGDIKESAYDFLFEPSDVQFGLTPEKDAEMSVYTEVVRSWNRTGRRSVSAAEGDSSKRQRHSDFVEDVHDRLNEIQDRVHSDVINLWGVARCMSVIGDVILADSRSNGSLVRRNTSIIFAPASSTYQAVQEEIQEWRSSSRGEEVIILRARKYLESSFRKKIGYPFTDVNDPLMNSDSGDQIFGESGAGEIQKIVNFTRHYINTFKTNMHFHLSNNGPIRQEPRAFGLPAWALIFFGLRCGDLKAAIRFAREATPPLGKFTAYLEEAFESTSRSGLPVPDLPRLSAESEAEMEAAYCSTLESEGDPFER